MAEPNEVAEQTRKDYQSVFSSEAGQRVLEDLKKTCFFYNTTFDPSVANQPFVSFFCEGQRATVLHIETKLKLSAQKLKELENDRGQTES